MDSSQNLTHDLSPRSCEAKKRKCSDDINQLYDLDNLKLESQYKIVIMSGNKKIVLTKKELYNLLRGAKMHRLGGS